MLVSSTSSIRSQSVSGIGAIGGARPALLRSRSISPQGSDSFAKVSTASRSRMSISSGRKASPISSARARSRSQRRPVPITRQPSRAKRRAAASPNPAVAPVIRIVLVMASPRTCRESSRSRSASRRFAHARVRRSGRRRPRAAPRSCAAARPSEHISRPRRDALADRRRKPRSKAVASSAIASPACPCRRCCK